MKLKTLEEKEDYLKQLAKERNYKNLNLTLNPNKNITKEMIIDDLIFLFELKRDKKMKLIFTTKGK